MLDQWEISTDKIHLVLWDNAANMAIAMREASFPSLECFAHSLQLIVEDGMLSRMSWLHVGLLLAISSTHQLLMVVFAPFKSVWEFHNTETYVPDGTLPYIWLNL